MQGMSSTQLASLMIANNYKLGAKALNEELMIDYSAGYRVRYGGLLYKCLTAHTSQDSWTPDAAPSLWVRIDDPAVEWPEWRQPQSSTDAYAQGAKVSHNGKHWVSTADSNVWEPGVYGWENV